MSEAKQPASTVPMGMPTAMARSDGVQPHLLWPQSNPKKRPAKSKKEKRQKKKGKRE
jgi:hypothetical protein